PTKHVLIVNIHFLFIRYIFGKNVTNTKNPIHESIIKLVLYIYIYIYIYIHYLTTRKKKKYLT
ncbi:MAG: hypothetical protein N7Q72_01770, partial [Spiroplasma sp. Tabriz.8]|nr:hypothetical protein [Candidatus Karelsulcia muelleri]MCZ8631971.1 hypothetical protein [Spiroplasma sp. Tabriz.8]